jgi:glucose/arabinose dehydrogenase
MRTVPFLVAAFALAACAEDGNPADDGTAVIVTTTIAAVPAAPGTSAPPVPVPASGVTASTTTSTPATAAPTAPPTTPQPVVGNPTVAATEIGSFDAPVGVAVRPGDAALYVIEQPGRVIRFDAATGDRRTVADIADRVSFGGEQGLLGLAFTADGTLAYLNFTDGGGDTNIVELPVAADGTFDVSGTRMLLEIGQPYRNHNGGDLHIGPDGTLYVAVGDGGSGGDPQRFASDPSSLLGTLVRIDPTPSNDGPYTIPADNPFAAGPLGGVAGAPEVWAWGLRNPWRIDIDPATGDLWIADVGQNRLEEINRVSPTAEHPAGRGLDFGWSAFEATDRFNDDVADTGRTTFPVLTYQHGDDGCSVSGGAVYRGSAIAELAPAYLYSDYCSGRLWALDLVGQRNLTLLDQFDQVASVDRGPDGELYVIERSGGIWRLVPG